MAADRDNAKLVRAIDAHKEAVVRLSRAIENIKLKELDRMTSAMNALARVFEDIDVQLARSTQHISGSLTQDKEDDYGDQEAEKSSSGG